MYLLLAKGKNDFPKGFGRKDENQGGTKEEGD
jgi:hypothetical protein